MSSESVDYNNTLLHRLCVWQNPSLWVWPLCFITDFLSQFPRLPFANSRGYVGFVCTFRPVSWAEFCFVRLGCYLTSKNCAKGREISWSSTQQSAGNHNSMSHIWYWLNLQRNKPPFCTRKSMCLTKSKSVDPTFFPSHYVFLLVHVKVSNGVYLIDAVGL